MQAIEFGPPVAVIVVTVMSLAAPTAVRLMSCVSSSESLVEITDTAAIEPAAASTVIEPSKVVTLVSVMPSVSSMSMSPAADTSALTISATVVSRVIPLTASAVRSSAVSTVAAEPSSRMSFPALSERSGVPESTLQRWSRKLAAERREEAPMPFAEIVPAAEDRSDARVEVLLRSGHVLYLEPGRPSEGLAELVALLEAC